MSREAMERRTCGHRFFIRSCAVCVRARKQPPLRHCRECGGDVYAWVEAPLCPSCTRSVGEAGDGETLRDFRRRVIDPTRNHLQDS